MSNNLISDRDWYSQQKHRIIARLSTKQGKSFEQALKALDRLNFDIRRLTKEIGDAKWWK